MRLILIAAIGENNELGKDNDLLWHLPTDMKFFINQTKGHTIVMGRKTFESLPGKLPKRHHVILSRSKLDFDDDIEVMSMETFLDKYQNIDEDIYCIGGGQIYTQLLPYADSLILTEIEASTIADTYFPQFDKAKYTKQILTDISENGFHYHHVRYDLIR